VTRQRPPTTEPTASTDEMPATASGDLAGSGRGGNRSWAALLQRTVWDRRAGLSELWWTTSADSAHRAAGSGHACARASGIADRAACAGLRGHRQTRRRAAIRRPRTAPTCSLRPRRRRVGRRGQGVPCS
jgi:hypothetical protein